MEQTSLYRDLLRNPRSSEDSRIVVSSWGAPTDRYASEPPAASDENDKVRAAYLALSAERLLYRGKVLALPVDEDLALDEAMQGAHPFGRNGPDFATLSTPSVSLAMALVPLTPEGGGGRPVLVRLYCANGLASTFPPPFADGADSPGLSRFSWFVAGLPGALAEKPVRGRSWLLAAHLLAKVVGRANAADTGKNLATRFVVTGDVDNGDIRQVEMGRKPELADIREYRNLKWIIPMKNSNEMNGVPARMVEKPATLEEAYELIESMQSRATRSFFRFLKAADLEGMKEQYANGADLFAEDDESGDMAMEIVGGEIRGIVKKIGDTSEASAKRELADSLDKFKQAREWLKQQGVDCAGLFYLLAIHGKERELASCSETLPINARDEEGLTALDMALNGGLWDAARMLHSFGGSFDTEAIRNKRLASAIEDVSRGKDSRAREELVKTALSMGLNPDAKCLFGNCVKNGIVQMVEACLAAGRDPNIEMRADNFGRSVPPIIVVAEDDAGMLDEATQGTIMNLLFKHGVRKTPELENKIRYSLARMFVKKGNRARIIESLENGLLSADGEDSFPVGVVFAGGVGGKVPVDGNLFALALGNGWVDVIAKCLEKGASPTMEIKTTYSDLDSDETTSGGGIPDEIKRIYEKASPIDYVNSDKRDLPPAMKREIVALLESYIAKGRAACSVLV